MEPYIYKYIIQCRIKKFLPQAKIWLIYAKKMTHAKWFLCNAKIAMVQAL